MQRPNDREQTETKSSLAPAERPTFNDLLDNTEAGVTQRGISRYLFSRNPDRSVKMYTYLGMPMVRTVVMGSLGRLIPRSANSNYRTDPRKTIIEGSTRFAIGGSVFNEGVHSAVATYYVYNTISAINGGENPFFDVTFLCANTALVGLQRYNRSRMVQRINQELAAGNTYDTDYGNWLGIDRRAVLNYQENNVDYKRLGCRGD